ncbi:MAG: tetratricopeptide repeat protein [Saprospiraceae bacterium]|nr:MAG: Photosystem I assembly protein Ycf3 [Bacteroidetes bacterium OLB9]MCO6462891.1 tetratricopeptide repeat protein [Saprospiraceae bacterium]
MNLKKESKRTPSIQKSAASLLPISLHAWLVFIFGALLYANTLSHGFTQDDAIVIYDNMYTTKGISGIKGLFTKDTFYGFFKEEGKAKLVSGGRYRPFTPAMFAIEYQLVGNNPWLGHLINILLYGFLCFMVYKLMVLMLCYKEDTLNKRYIALAITLLYAAHPLHTEAVANIKGRDEIMSMLGSVVSLYYILKFTDTKQIKALIIALISFFIAFLSKENTITFLAVIPLALYYFRDKSIRHSIVSTLPLLIPTIVFLLMRTSVLGNDFGGTPMELMNNPFLKLSNGVYVPFSASEKAATIIFTLGKYIQLLLFPHPLTHDYYPRYIDIMHFGDYRVVLSLLVYILLGYIAFRGFKTKSIVAFGAAYYLVTLSIVSNIVFPIGTNMSERFMFMPSLGFAMMVGWAMYEWVFKKLGKKVFFSLLGVIILLFSLKTFTRNQVWESDFKLFTTDVKTSTNSAKVLNAAGGALTTKAFDEKDEAKKKNMLHEAIGYLTKAVKIHPGYKNAYLIMGNAYYYLKDYDHAIEAYGNALKIDPDFKDAFVNQAIVLREAGKYAGETLNDLKKAEIYLTRSYQMNPNDMETTRLLGVLSGIKGNHQDAVKYFSKVVEADPKNANAQLNLSIALQNAGELLKAEEHRKKAEALGAEQPKN